MQNHIDNITMGTGVEAARLAVPLERIGRSESERGRICDIELAPKDETFWDDESDFLCAHAAAVVHGLQDEAGLAHPKKYPVLSVLDPQIARLVLSKEETPIPDLTMKDVPQSVRQAIMDPMSAEALLLMAQSRRVIEILEIAIVRRDYVGVDNATRGLAMRIAGVAQLAMEGGKAKKEFCDDFLLKYEWQEITKALTSPHTARPHVDTQERRPM